MRTLLLLALASIWSIPAYSSCLSASVPKGKDAATLAFVKAVQEFRELSRAEKKARVLEVRKIAKSFNTGFKEGQEVDAELTLLVILAVLLPPLAVYLKEGEINSRFWISLLLTILFWLPGMIYSLLVVLNKD